MEENEKELIQNTIDILKTMSEMDTKDDIMVGIAEAIKHLQDYGNRKEWWK